MLGDFYSHALVAHKLEPHLVLKTWPLGLYTMAVHLGMTHEEFNLPLHNAEFWATMPWMPDGRWILSTIEDTECDIFIWTRPSLTPGCDDGKRQWVHDHIPRYDDKLIIGGGKEVAAHSNSLLVDDMDGNIIKFVEAGGNAILVPRIWNSRHALRHVALGTLMGELDAKTCGISD